MALALHPLPPRPDVDRAFALVPVAPIGVLLGRQLGGTAVVETQVYPPSLRGEAFARLRGYAGLSQRQAAQALGVLSMNVEALESGAARLEGGDAEWVRAGRLLTEAARTAPVGWR